MEVYLIACLHAFFEERNSGKLRSREFLILIIVWDPQKIVDQVQFNSIVQSCPTLCDPMDCNTPGLPIHHQLPELAQTHVDQVSDAIQPSHPLSSPSPSTFNLYQHQGLFQWLSSLHQVANYWSSSFRISPSNVYSRLISFRIDWFDLLAVRGLSRIVSNTTIQKHQFFSAQLSLWSYKSWSRVTYKRKRKFDKKFHKV